MALKSNQNQVEVGNYLLFFREIKLRNAPFMLEDADTYGTGSYLFWAQSFIKDAGRVLVNPGMKGYTGATPSMIDSAEDESSSHAGVGHMTNQGEDWTSSAVYYAWGGSDAVTVSERADADTEQHYAEVVRIVGSWVELDFGSASTTYSNWPSKAVPSRGGTDARIKYAWIKLSQVFKSTRIYDAAPRSS